MNNPKDWFCFCETQNKTSFIINTIEPEKIPLSLSSWEVHHSCNRTHAMLQNMKVPKNNFPEKWQFHWYSFLTDTIYPRWKELSLSFFLSFLPQLWLFILCKDLQEKFGWSILLYRWRNSRGRVWWNVYKTKMQTAFYFKLFHTSFKTPALLFLMLCKYIIFSQIYPNICLFFVF